jgi:thioredoxin reductase (NADPH)
MTLFTIFLIFAHISCSSDDDFDFGWGDDEEVEKPIVWEEVPVVDSVIIGSGPAGCAAAIYLGRAGYKPLVIQGHVLGGQLMYTSEIENYPGFKGTGPELMQLMQKQAEEAHATFVFEKIATVNFTIRPFRLTTESNTGIQARSVIIATGANARYLNIPSEQRLRNRGVSACAVCDGSLFTDQDVAIVGGGDCAIEEALYLSRICSSVKLIHRRDSLRASQSMQKKLFESKIELIWNSVVDEVLGEDFVNGVRLKNVKTGELVEHKIGALFIAIGHDPATEPFRNETGLEFDTEGYFVTDGTPRTGIPGIFVAGDCADKVFRQAITSAGTGCQAALLAERFLREDE